MDWLQTIVNNSEIISDDEDVFNFTTTSPPEAAPQRTEGALVRVIVLLLMAILSTIGNVWTIWNIQKSRVAKKLTRQNCTAIYLLITHLSIADLLVTGFCMIGESVWSYTVQWLAGEFLCKSVKFAQMFSLYLSTYVLVLIGIDRLFAVKFPIRTANMGRQCKRFLLIVYGLSALFSLPQVISICWDIIIPPSMRCASCFSTATICCADNGYAVSRTRSRDRLFLYRATAKRVGRKENSKIVL